MEIGQKILDTIYKHNKSVYAASSECIEVVYADDYDDLTDDLVKLFSLHIVSKRFWYFDCWDKTGKMQSRQIEALNAESAEIIFKARYEDFCYDPPY